MIDWVAGPIVRKELAGASRHVVTYVARTLYIAILALALYGVWHSYGRSGQLTYSEFARMGRDLFHSIAITQMILVAFVSVVVAADMVSKEVRGDTLGILFLTPLRPWRIVLGKWKACFGMIALLVLSGTPAMAVNVYLGGVTLEEFAGVTALTLVTCALCVSVSIFVSTLTRNAYGSMTASSLLLVAWAILPPGIAMAVTSGSPTRLFKEISFVDPVALLGGLLYGGLGFDPWEWLAPLGVQAGIAALVLWLASLRLTRVAKADRRLPAIRRYFFALDRLFDTRHWLGTKLFGGTGEVWEGAPFLWKELHTRVTGSFRYVVRITLPLLLVAAIVCARYPEALIRGQMDLALMVGAMPILFFLAAGAGAASFAKEREEGKWQVLMTLPVTAGEVVWAKLAGACASLTPLVLVLASFLLFPMTFWKTVGPALTFYLVSGLFALFLVCVGMHFSTVLRTTRAAFAATSAVGFFCIMGFPLLIALMVNGHDVPTVIRATNPFMYVEQMVEAHWESGWYIRPKDAHPGALAAYLLIYGVISGVILMNLAGRFDMIRRKE